MNITKISITKSHILVAFFLNIKGDDIMSISSFHKFFKVNKNKVNEFVKELSTKTVPNPILNFNSNFTSNKNFIQKITNILNSKW